MFEIQDNVFTSPHRLTQSVVQVADMLGMYAAELARVLRVKCEDVGRLMSAKELIQPDGKSWNQAVLFVRFYQALYRALDGDEVAIYHWLRAENDLLGGVPLMLIVDHDQLVQVTDFLINYHAKKFHDISD
ncbi:hypothetical protein [Kaarinaea lacus]